MSAQCGGGEGTGDGDDGAGSPPCLLHAVAPDGTLCPDLQQARDVGRWRKVERERLIAERIALPAEMRASQTSAIARELDELVPGGAAVIVSIYWPIRAEPDLREWMRGLHERGVTVALPVAVALGQPLKFRVWHPGCALVRGLWKIPYPADGAEVTPTVVLAPLVGFDRACYRLGYGGGFFDRTLAGLASRPLVIGLGYPGAELATIYPQPHDVPMDWIVTGSGRPLERDRLAVPDR
jgi:5,10-methenyltetrahydrofolate synthetase